MTALAILGVLAFALFPTGQALFQNLLSTGIDTIYQLRNEPVEKERLYELSPIDEEGAKRIDATDPVDKDDTWTICVLLVGSNLEDDGEMDLSPVTQLQVKKQLEEGILPETTPFSQKLDTYIQGLQANGLDLPEYLYYPIQPSGADPQIENPNYVSTRKGAASSDIDEITSGAWSDNINIVIQTGGATRWSNQMVNPNRTQRFLYKSGIMKEVDSLPLQPSSTVPTLTDFLTFCRDNYPADHTMLILWNHGGGAFGYGNDSIYGSARCRSRTSARRSPTCMSRTNPIPPLTSSALTRTSCRHSRSPTLSMALPPTMP
ncbi:MAG: hypothetical protein J6D34_04185 [Atopobiaceae bacterium]|nr:hypothetical protein [Atopobiaceae bacterium]